MRIIQLINQNELEEFGLIGIQVWKSCGEEIERLKEERERERMRERDLYRYIERWIEIYTYIYVLRAVEKVIHLEEVIRVVKFLVEKGGIQPLIPRIS